MAQTVGSICRLLSFCSGFAATLLGVCLVTAAKHAPYSAVEEFFGGRDEFWNVGVYTLAVGLAVMLLAMLSMALRRHRDAGGAPYSRRCGMRLHF